MPNYNVMTEPINPMAAQLFDDNGFPQNLSQTAFGDLRVANRYAQTGWTFNYNINTDIVNTTTAGSGTITQSNAKAVLQTGAAINSSAQIQTKKFARYIPGLGLQALFTSIFSTGAAGSTQLIGLGDNTDGLFFGCNNTNFGIMRRQNGTDTWIPQTTWNRDKLDGKGLSGITLDKTKGNVYSIRLQWLGFGLITFSVINPITGFEIIVHQIQYANTSVNPHIFNPNLPITALVSNISNNTNIMLQTTAAAVFLEGMPTNVNSTVNAFGVYQVNTLSGETLLMAIQNKSTIAGIPNRVQLKLQSLSISNNGGQMMNIRLLKNATLTGTTTFSDINSVNSVAAYNTAGIYSAGTGKYMMGLLTQKVDAQNHNLTDYDLLVLPGEIITITANAAGSGIPVSAVLTWREFY